MIESLTVLQRDVLRRHYAASESYSEIGRTRGTSKQAVHRIHQRAIYQLKKRISKFKNLDG
jgi:DNA-directed RNA polymerase specialized sigma24 family protein